MQTQRATISCWGKSTAVRIPSDLFKASGLRMGQTVQFEQVEGGGILMRPVRERLQLDALLEQVSEENMPDDAAVDWGKALGTELW